MTDRDIQAHYDGITFSGPSGTSKGAPDWLVKETKFPDTKPYFAMMRVNSQNLLEFHTYKGPEEKFVIDIYNLKGEKLSDMTSDKKFLASRWIDKDELYEIARDGRREENEVEREAIQTLHQKPWIMDLVKQLYGFTYESPIIQRNLAVL